MIMVAHPSVSAKSVADLIAYAKANPGKVTMASFGTGSAWFGRIGLCTRGARNCGQCGGTCRQMQKLATRSTRLGPYDIRPPASTKKR